MSCERERRTIAFGNSTINSDDTKDFEERDNILSNPIESILRLFIMTIGEFSKFYRDLTTCPVSSMSTIGKIMFLIFELIVSLMQFNLLIAMMTRTYEEIYRTQKEWKRQVIIYFLSY